MMWSARRRAARRWETTRQVTFLVGKDALPEGALGLDIQGAGEVVEDQQFGLADEHAGGGRALDLAAGELDALRADHGVQAILELAQIALHHGGIDGVA